MDNTVVSLVYGLLGLIVVHGSLEKRIQHDATRNVQASFDSYGSVRTSVMSSGVFGAFANRLYSIDVYGDDVSSDRLPFVAIPRRGWKGSIRHLRLHLTRIHLAGLPVDSFYADIPDVRYDLGHALYKDRLVIRSAGEGPARVAIGSESLRTYILRKYSNLMDSVVVAFEPPRVIISGSITILGKRSSFSAAGQLRARDRRFVDIVDPSVQLGGVATSELFNQTLLRQINPVLDIERDLHLKGYFEISDVQVKMSGIVVDGTARVPVQTERDVTDNFSQGR